MAAAKIVKFGMSSWLLAAELEQMSDYLDTVHKFLDEEMVKFKTSVEEQASKLSDEDKEDFYEYSSTGYWELRDVFPEQLYSSFVPTWFTFVEHQFVRICQALRLSMPNGRGRGSTTNKAKDILQKEYGYVIDTKQWDEFANIREVRNRIVHGNTKFNIVLGTPKNPNTDVVSVTSHGEIHNVKIEQELYNNLTSHGIFAFESVPSIKITFDYCQYLVAFGKTFFFKIYKDLKLD